jgi:hypothetical protein
VIVFGIEARSAVVRPEFTARQIGPTGGWLWPGRMFSIYGKNLGPTQSCVRSAGPFRPDGPNSAAELEPVERALPALLCGVQVLVDEEPVPLIYVHERQINFVVPGSRTFGDKVMLRVVRMDVSSIPIRLKFGPDRMWLSQQQATYTEMPVWVHLYNVSEGKQPFQLGFVAPVIWPSEKCPHIEVRYDGALLPELRTKNPPRRIAYSGSLCPALPVPDRQSLAGRIPLHLRFRMDHPGTYFARFVPGTGVFRFEPTVAETAWTPVVLKPGTKEQRRKWLLARAQSAPADREGLLYDFLPSIFGYGDPEALNIALKYLWHPDEWVWRSTAGFLANYYAASDLIPALRRAQRGRGKNGNVDQLLRDIGESRDQR